MAFAVNQTDFPMGTYDVTASTEDDSETATLIITATDRPTRLVTSLDAPDTEQGEIANVTATVDGVGDVAGTQNTRLQSRARISSSVPKRMSMMVNREA